MIQLVTINTKRDNFTLYIGREFAGLAASTFRNPYPVSSYGRTKALILFERHARFCLLEHLHKLDDQILGCWCKDLRFCHGRTLIRLREEMLNPRLSDFCI